MRSQNKTTLMTIDNGNTHPHVGIFSKNKLQKVYSWSEFLQEKKLSADQEIPFVLSHVGAKLPLLQQKKWQARQVDLKEWRRPRSFLQMPVNYSETLGDDRLYQAYYLYRHFAVKKKKNYLLIDNGTFITIDRITARGGLEGGFIFPGLALFLQSYQNGRLLPALPVDRISFQSAPQTPHQTQEAILQATLLYLRGLTQQVLQLYPDTQEILLTGGMGKQHAALLRKILKQEKKMSAISLRQDPHFIHHSLAAIYREVMSFADNKNHSPTQRGKI